MLQVARVRKYRAFRKEIKLIAKKYIASYCNPLGEHVINGFNRYERKFAKLPLKWQNYIDHRLELAMNEYHKPVVQGHDGQWYSAAEMNDLMIHG